MAIASGLLTYGDLNAREDVVLNAIEILTVTSKAKASIQSVKIWQQ